MRLANGYGSITKLSGNRQRPWMVRITTGFDDDGKQFRKVLGYYASRTKALEALTEFNREPYDIDNAKFTFKDIYSKRIGTNEYEKLSESSKKTYKYAYNDFSLLHNKIFIKIKIADLQQCIDRNTSGYTSNRFMKNLASKLYQYAIINEVVKTNKALMLKVGSPDATKNERKPYTDEEIETLWNNTADDIVKIILIFIYTGVRCNELLQLRKEEVHLDEQYFNVVKSKTTSGIRIVPIADRIVPFFKYFEEKSPSGWVFTTQSGVRINDSYWRKQQSTALKGLNMQHTTHEARHTCITQMTIHNVNPTVIKEIVGHKAAQSFTESVYTHIYLKTKIEAVNTIHTK